MCAKGLSLLFCLAMTAPVLAQQSSEPVELKAEPAYQRVLENQHAGVFNIEIPPRKTSGLHRHRHPWILVVLEESRILERGRGMATETRFIAGDTLLLAGDMVHTITNRASTSFRAVVVELLNVPQQPPARFGEAGDLCLYAQPGISRRCKADFHASREFFGGKVVVTGQEIASGGSLPRHEHKYDHLAIAVTPLELKSETEGRPPTFIRQPSGASVWIRRGVTHTLTNTSSQLAKFVTVEFR
jgi:quercetin dioxygenase-like cupin family protein